MAFWPRGCVDRWIKEDHDVETQLQPEIKQVQIVHAPATTTASVPTPTAKVPNTLVTCLLPGLVTSLLFGLCFQPVAWGFLGWVALAPFLLLVRSAAPHRKLYVMSYFAGAAFFFPILTWMTVADKWMMNGQNVFTAILHLSPMPMHGAWILLGTYCSFYFPVALWMIRWLDQRRTIPLILSVALVWTFLEFVRSFALTGFAWYYLAHTQHDWLAMIQVADLGGAYALSFLVAACNGFVADLLYQSSTIRRWLHLAGPKSGSEFASWKFLNYGWMYNGTWRKDLVFEAVILAAAFASVYLYGDYRMKEAHFADGPIVTLLQGNLDQRLRNEVSRDAGPDVDEREAERRRSELVDKIGIHYAVLVDYARKQQPKPDLVVWPETSYPQSWWEVSREIPVDKVPEDYRRSEAVMREHFSGVGKMSQLNHLIGVPAIFLDKEQKPRAYNSAILVKAHGSVETRYDKMHRVPFGEYVPFRDWLPFMKWFSPYDFDYSVQAGQNFTRFDLGTHKFGVLICYEDTDPFLARRYLTHDADGAPVDFLLNISNDGWFDGSSEHAEHLAISRFRAVECRRAVARAVNMGISAIIDGNGQLRKPTKIEIPNSKPGDASLPDVWAVQTQNNRHESWPQSKWTDLRQTYAIVSASIPLDRRWSFYTYAGDWLPLTCLAAILVVGVRRFLTKPIAQPAGASV